MNAKESEPKRLSDILRDEGIVDAEGNIDREGMVAAFARLPESEPRASVTDELDPNSLEHMPKDALAKLILDPATDLETLQEINRIAQMRFSQEQLPPEEQ